LIPETIARPASRLGAAAQNAFEVARFGGLETGEEPSPFEVVAERSVHRLRRYYPDGGGERPPVVLVPPMMLAAEVYDVSPSSSAVSVLHEHGIDPWVVDFGAPEREEGGLERNLADHVVAVSEAIDAVRERTGADVHLGGYSQGRRRPSSARSTGVATGNAGRRSRSWGSPPGATSSRSGRRPTGSRTAARPRTSSGAFCAERRCADFRSSGALTAV
jgi:hypothetical protein